MTVRNTGDQALSRVWVLDFRVWSCIRRIGRLDVGEEVTYRCRAFARRSFSHTAVALGRSEDGTKVHDRATASVTVVRPGDDD